MNKWIVALSVILPTLIEVIDTSVVNVSLDHIRGSLSAGVDEATWTITAYLVSNAIIIPITGWLSKFFGRKRYLIYSIILFTASSFMCGASTTLASLVFFRILQGIGGGALQPISQAILLETFPVKQHGIAMAIFGVGVMFGPIIGPILGGWITDNWSWHWIFYINIPIGIISILMIMKFIKDPDYMKRVKTKVDYWGLALITVGLGCLQIVLDKGQQDDWFSSNFILTLSIISAVSLIAFIFVELRSKDPVVNLRVFKNISFASGNFIQFIAFFVLFGSIVLLPLYVQQLMGYTAFLAGLALGPGGIATLLTMPLVGRFISQNNSKYMLTAGIIIAAYSTYMMAQFNLAIDFNTIMWSRFIMGIGMGLIFIPLVGMTLSTIKKEEMGNATGVFNLLRNLGGSFGVAFITTLLARRAQVHQFRLSEHMYPLDPQYQIGSLQAAHALQAKGMAVTEMSKNAVMYKQMMLQANYFSFIDTFFAATVIMLAVLPLVLLLKAPKNMETTMVA